MARGDLLILGRQNEEWVPHRLSGGVRRDYHETGMGEGGGPSARRLFTQSDESTGPARPRLTLLGRAVWARIQCGVCFFGGVSPTSSSPLLTAEIMRRTVSSD